MKNESQYPAFRLGNLDVAFVAVGCGRSMLRQRISICLAMLLGILLVGCGGSGTQTGSITPPPEVSQAPVFTSAAPTQAAEGQPYSYSASATDPAGGTVTLALTQAPVGATMSGNALSWTPAWEQSRVANQFELSATNTKGLTTKQRWTVSPAGTVYVKCTERYFAANGTEERIQRPAGGSLYLPENNFNGYREINPAVMEDGTAKFVNVPAGAFYIPTLPCGFNDPDVWGPGLWNTANSMMWTNKSALDLGMTYTGRRIDQNSYSTTLSGKVGGTRTEGQLNQLLFRVPNVRGYQWARLEDGTSTWEGEVGSRAFDAAKGDKLYITEYAHDQPVNPFWMLRNRLVGFAEQDNISAPENSTVPLNTMLNAVANEQKFHLNLRGSEWSDGFRQMFNGASAESVSVGLYARPFMSGKRTWYDGFITGTILPTFSVPYLMELVTSPPDFPAVDADLGNFYFSNPFPANWGLDFVLRSSAVTRTHYSITGNEPATLGGEIALVTTTVPSEADIVTPLVKPVTNIMVDGKNASAAQVTINTYTPVISWTPPATSARIAGYVVSGYLLVFDETCQSPPSSSYCWGFYPAGASSAIYTTQTSMTLSPMAVNVAQEGVGNWGKVYAVVLRVRVITDPEADLETNAMFQRPTGWADAYTELIFYRR